MAYQIKTFNINNVSADLAGYDNIVYGGYSYTRFDCDTPGYRNINNVKWEWLQENTNFKVMRIGVYRIDNTSDGIRDDNGGKFATLSFNSNIQINNCTSYYGIVGESGDKPHIINETKISDDCYNYCITLEYHTDFKYLFVLIDYYLLTDKTKRLIIEIDTLKTFIYNNNESVNKTLGYVKNKIIDIKNETSKSPLLSNLGQLYINKINRTHQDFNYIELSYFSLKHNTDEIYKVGIFNDNMYIKGTLSMYLKINNFDSYDNINFYSCNTFNEETLLVPVITFDDIIGKTIYTVSSYDPYIYLRFTGDLPLIELTILPSSGYYTLDNIYKNYYNKKSYICHGKQFTEINKGSYEIIHNNIYDNTNDEFCRFGIHVNTNDNILGYLRIVFKYKPIEEILFFAENIKTNEHIVITNKRQIYSDSNYYILESWMPENSHYDSFFIQYRVRQDNHIHIDNQSFITGNVKNNYSTSLESNIYKYLIDLKTAYKQIHVKKDGTGDFTNIPDAINSIYDATVTNQYEILIYDDWEWNDPENDFNSSGSIFNTKNYVHLRGMFGTRLLFVNLPNNVTVNQIQNRQVIWWHYNCNITNIEFRIKNGRYAVHTDDYTKDANSYKKCTNVIFNHLGNHHADNYLKWTSDAAWGIGSANGSIYEFDNCKFISREYTITSHTNHDFNAPNKFIFKSCHLISKVNGPVLYINNLGSQDNVFMELEDCTIYGYIKNTPDMYGPNQINYNAVFTNNYITSGSNNTDTFFMYDKINVLKIECSYNKFISNVYGNSADVLFGNKSILRKGISDLTGILIGDIDLRYDLGTTFGENYMCSIGHRLGDCTSSNKQLIIQLSDDTIAIHTFDKDYSGGSDVNNPPAYTNKQIIDEMNGTFNIYGITVYDYLGGEFEQYLNFADKIQYGINASETESLYQGDCIQVNVYGEFEKATSKIDGLLCRDLSYKTIDNELDDTTVIIKTKIFITYNYFSPIKGNPKIGTKYDINNGKLVLNNSSSNPAAIVIRDDIKIPTRDVSYFGYEYCSVIKILL